MSPKHIFQYWYIFVCIGAGVLASLPLFHAGFPPTHDGEYQVIRFHQFYKMLADGILYPRWEPDLNFGYGVPLLNYYYPLPNYIAAIFHLFGMSFINAFKYTMVVAIIIGSIFSYLWAKHFFGNVGGMVTSVLYTFSPYHFVDIYIRGSSGEVWALAFFPAFLWSITKLIRNGDKHHIPVSIFFLSLIIFSHNILAYMFFLFVVTYIFFLVIQKEKKLSIVKYVAIVVFVSMGITTIFWMPALLERGYVRGLQIYDYQFHFPEMYQLLIPTWGSGFSSGDLQNQMSFQLGVANLLGVIGGITAYVLFQKKKDHRKKILVFFLVWFVIVVFLLLPTSQPVWETVPLLPYFQFPWRLLSLAILIMSFLGGSFFATLHNKVLSLVFILFAIAITIQYTKPAYYHYREDSHYLTRSNFIDGTNTPGNAFNTIWFREGQVRQQRKLRLVNTSGNISVASQKATYFKANVVTDKNGAVIIHTAYFPGWQAKVDGKGVSLFPTEMGLITFPILQGQHTVEVYLGLTTLQKIATMITMLSLFVWLLLIRQSFAKIRG